MYVDKDRESKDMESCFHLCELKTGKEKRKIICVYQFQIYIEIETKYKLKDTENIENINFEVIALAINKCAS